MELAAKAGFHFTYISDVENGKRNVTLDTILRLAGALEINPGSLVDGLMHDDLPANEGRHPASGSSSAPPKRLSG